MYSKRYVVFTVLLAVALIFKFSNYSHVVAEEVGDFRGAVLEAKEWNPMIAQSINDKPLSVTIDNKVYTNTKNGVYMDENLNLMLPVNVLRDGYNCSVHLYENEDLMIEKYSDVLHLAVDEPVICVNDQESSIASPLTLQDGVYYAPAEVIAKNLGYSYNWDVDDNVAVVTNTSEAVSILPASYDLRDRQRCPKVKNQGNKGTCWAAASLAALESAMLPEERAVYSTDHMSLENSFGLGQDDGGDYTMSLAYLLAWQGPVDEADDPYDGEGVSGLSAVKHVQEAQVIESKDFEKIKEAVFKYGAVQTSIYSSLQNAQSQSTYYNKATHAYCYMGSEKPNHDVVIIGWDDHYPKENFTSDLEGDGAFICQNSWGETFGEDGVFYVSYYDTNIGIHNLVYTSVEDTDNYDRIYQSDLCGWVGQLGYNRDTAYGANIYQAEFEETLQAVGFYATGKNTEYEIQVVIDYSGKADLNQGTTVASGRVDHAGYYTVDLDKNLDLDAGEKFAVILKITTPDSVHPLAIEYVADDTTALVDITDGEGYISSTGKNWESVEDTQNSNLCLKAYTKER